MNPRQPVLVSVRNAALQLGVPRAHLLREVEAGRLPGIRVGRTWKVPLERVAAILSNQAASIRTISDMLADLRAENPERRLRGMIDLARSIGAGMALQGLDQLDAEHGIGRDLSALLGQAAAGDAAAVDRLERVLTNKPPTVQAAAPARGAEAAAQ